MLKRSTLVLAALLLLISLASCAQDVNVIEEPDDDIINEFDDNENTDPKNTLPSPSPFLKTKE